MELLVIRHAIAAEPSDDRADADRPLTRRGRRRFREVVRGLRKLDLRVDRILTSPWRRAAQSADLALPLLRGRGWIESCAHLIGPPRVELLSAITYGGPGRVAVVGHQPWLSELTALLVTGDVRDGEALPIKKGGVVLIEGDLAPAGMTLRSFLSPRVLRRLA